MAKRRIKKPVRRKKESDYPGEMSFRKALGMNPTYYQEGGKLYYQEDIGKLPVKYVEDSNDPAFIAYKDSFDLAKLTDIQREREGAAKFISFSSMPQSGRDFRNAEKNNLGKNPNAPKGFYNDKDADYVTYNTARQSLNNPRIFISPRGSADIFHPSIDPTSVYFSSKGAANAYYPYPKQQVAIKPSGGTEGYTHQYTYTNPFTGKKEQRVVAKEKVGDQVISKYLNWDQYQKQKESKEYSNFLYQDKRPAIIPKQQGGKLYYQEDIGDLPTTKYGTPEYEEAYRTGNLLVNGVKPLPEFKVTPEYKSLSDELRRAAIVGIKEAAELTGVPGAVRFARSPVQSLKGAGNTIVDLGLMAGAGLSPVGRFGQMNPMGGAQYAKQGTNPLTGEGSFRAEDVEGAFNTLDAAGLATIAGVGLKAPLQQGFRQTAKNNLFKTLNTKKTQFSKALQGSSSLFNEIIGELKQGKLNKKSIEEGNKWLQNYINHPSTQMRIDIAAEDAIKNLDQKYSWIDTSPEGIQFKQRLINQDANFINLVREQTKKFKPNSKEYSLLKQFDDNLQQYLSTNAENPIHLDNWGVSYMHNVNPSSREFIKTGATKPFDRYGSWISRTAKQSQPSRVSTTIHEGTHDWISAEAFEALGQKKIALDPNNVSQEAIESYLKKQELINEGKTSQEILDILGEKENYIGYLADPTEQHSRISELRAAANIPPDYSMDEATAKQMLEWIESGHSPVDKGFAYIVDYDANKLKNLFNKFLVAPTIMGTGAGVYGVNQIQNTQPTMRRFGGKLRYARGGSLTSAQDTAQAADLNQDVMRKDIKKASVGEDFMAGLYGVGEGLLDTVTFGLTDELTDAGFKALQAGAGHDVNSDEAKRQAGIAGWGNVAGAVTGAIINPGAIGSAAEEGLEGIGTGIEGIDPSSDIATGIGTSLKGMAGSKVLGGLNDKDKIPEGMQGFSKLFMARNGGRFRYGYRGGGQMLNQNMGLTEIDGPSHEQGGVTLPNSGGRPDVEVEGPETIYTPENYVMSEKMKASKEALEYAGITGKAASRLAGKSYADLSKAIKSKAGDKLRPADPLSKKMLDKEMKRLMMAHEYDREAKRMKDEAMRSQMMGGSNIIAETPEERAGGYNMYPNAESIAFPGNGATSVVPTYNNDPIMVTGADGSQQMLTDEPIETEAPFIEQKMAQGGKMIKRADGSYSKRGLWDNIRANRGSGRKPTKQMLEQEAKIKAAEKAYGGYYADGGSFDNPGFRALPSYVQAKIKSNMALGGDMAGLGMDMETANSMQGIGNFLKPITQTLNNVADIESQNNEYQMQLGGFMGDYIDEDDTMEYGEGGYTVRKSNDRKGKTHVVTGPDGTKKYFGDPNLGERGKSKYGKDAFYARHKKNLAKNPYFRAYARATWEDGGYMNMLDSNVDMVDMETPMYEYGGSMMYGQGGGIHIDPSKRGTFKAQASRMGMGVQQAASSILNAPEGKYSPAMRKKANFARNFAKADGGYMYQMGGEMMAQQPQGQPQGGSGQEEIMQQVAQMLQQGMAPEEIVGQLVQMGVPQEQAIQIVQMIVQQMQGQQQAPQEAPQQAPPMMRRGGYMYQMGGEMAPQQAPQQGGSQEQIMQAIVQMLQQGLQPEQIVGELVKMGIPQEAAIQAVQMVMQQAQQSQGMQQQQQAAPPAEQGMMSQQGAPATMRGGGRMYQMGGSLADNYLAQVNQYPVLKRGGGKLYYQDAGLLPDEGYAAINQFENTMGTYDTQGNPIGMGRGDQYAQTHTDNTKIQEYINSNIGMDNWNNLPDNLKTQIYSFMFNHGNYDNAIKGLNQAVLDSTGAGEGGGTYSVSDMKSDNNNLIDPGGQFRSTLSNKFNQNVDYSNPDIYNNYINVLGSQYSSIARNNLQFNTGVGTNYAPTLRNRAISIHNNLYPATSSTSAQSATVAPQARVSKADLLPIPTTTSQPILPSLMNNEVELTGLKEPQISPELVYKTFPVGKPKPKSAPPLGQYKSPMGNYIAGGVGSMLGPLANAAAAAFAPDPTYTAAPKLGRYDYTPVALQRAQANQAMANTRQAIRMGAPTQGSYLANVGVALPSAGASYGSQIAQTRYGIDAQNMGLANQEATLRAAQAEKNALMKDQSISNRWKLGMEAAAGTGRNIQGFSKDLAAKRMQDMMVNQLRTGDFSSIGYDLVNGKLVPKVAPAGLATYNDGITTLNNGQRIRFNPETEKYELLP
jgi:hypothetical protein